eukprot:Nitzschia sp. Nitz4//scaffold7_size249615//118673//119827//NITZ4_001175-RA/size249615-processed-gene-0.195-mRNA-1//-1//CDS//3329558436//1109//frame0
METRRPRSKVMSLSMLLFLGFTLLLFLTGTNLLLALSLPGAVAPHWSTMQMKHKFHRSLVAPKANTSVWETQDRDMLHIVTSRFMQLQPDLVWLGRARMQLFETFCLPTMQVQDVQDFIWFIMVDPELDKELLDRMTELLSPHPNFYVVLMNNRLVSPEFIANNSNDLNFATGDVDLLRLTMLDTNRPILLETRLDADDGLNKVTLRRLREAARKLPDDHNGWQVVCNDIHFEWRNDNIVDGNSTIDTSGQLRLVTENICITAGYTLVRRRPRGSIEFPSWPHIGHHIMHRDWPKCMGKRNASTNCWVRLPKYPAAIRSRTPTSAGMSRVQATDKDSIYDNCTDQLWKYVERDFSIYQDGALATSQFLKTNLKDIVEDNIRGQW